MVIPKLVRLNEAYYRVVRMEFPKSGPDIDLEELEHTPKEIEEYEQQSLWYRSNGYEGIFAPPGAKIPQDLGKICFLRKLDDGWHRINFWDQIKDGFVGWN